MSNKQINLPYLENIKFSILNLEEKDDFLSFLKENFPGRWEYEAIHYFMKGGKGREFVIAKKNSDIVGFCRINDSHSPFIAQNVYWAPLFDKELGGIEPLGIAQKERGKGLGIAIVQAGIYFLYQRKIKDVVIDWTDLENFYRKLGWEAWKQYFVFKKVLL
ncbi:GNAT family N-acetyltransferase [Caldanaerobacter subterraneus]|uniref:GNAT family N-acetyltransferase n=1 Tax=Caldanaerobacter subterraneus TaxID=911092 RepID=UPI001FB729E9|nr:GNAT family N-acetyltransferase [Caldanaerobacter subterraneus]